MIYNFCIVTQPRSGDELLISKLRSHPNIYITLGKPYNEFLTQNQYKTFAEYLLQHKYNKQNYELKYNEQDITHSLNTKEYMISYYDELIKVGCINESERQQIYEYLDLIYSRDKEKKKEGYEKATQHTLQRYTNYGLTLYGVDFLGGKLNDIQTNNLKYIVLFRKNLLWQYVSTQLPVETNEHGYTKIIDTKLTLNAHQFEQFVDTTINERSEVLKTLQNINASYIEIYYEDLARKSRITIDTIQNHLNVPIQETDLYGINPLNIYEETRHVDAIVDNYSELKEQLSTNELIASYFKDAEDSVNPFYYEIRKAGTFKSLDFLREMYEGNP